MVPLLDSREVMYVPNGYSSERYPDPCSTGSNSNKVRIIALYIQFREGVPDEDRRRLYQHARLTRPEMDAVNALVHLGVRISRVRNGSSSRPDERRGELTVCVVDSQGPGDKDLRRRIKQKQTTEDEYELSRYKPLLRTVIEVRVTFHTRHCTNTQTKLQDQVAGKLDPAGFPYVKDYPQAAPAAFSARPTPTPTTSLRSAKPSWHRAARTGGAVAETRQRVLVFVAGGMTYSEMREAYSLSSQLGKDVIIGTPPQQAKPLNIYIYD